MNCKMPVLTESQKDEIINSLVKFRSGVQSARDAGMETHADEVDDLIAQVTLATLTASGLQERAERAEADASNWKYMHQGAVDALNNSNKQRGEMQQRADKQLADTRNNVNITLTRGQAKDLAMFIIGFIKDDLRDNILDQISHQLNGVK